MCVGRDLALFPPAASNCLGFFQCLEPGGQASSRLSYHSKQSFPWRLLCWQCFPPSGSRGQAEGLTPSCRWLIGALHTAAAHIHQRRTLRLRQPGLQGYVAQFLLFFYHSGSSSILAKAFRTPPTSYYPLLSSQLPCVFFALSPPPYC